MHRAVGAMQCMHSGRPAAAFGRCRNSPSHSALARPTLQQGSITRGHGLPVAGRCRSRRSCTRAATVEDRMNAGDVSNVVINPAYRSFPQSESAENLSKIRVLLLGESNTCRSVIAEAILNSLIEQHGIQDVLECKSRACRDYELGSGPGASTLAAAAQAGLALPAGKAACLFHAERDVAAFDLLLVMDKFVAADVMRDVAGYDLIKPGASYSSKVRRLGEFHPVLSQRKQPDAQDIDDPLYGNIGGQQEVDTVVEAVQVIRESCQGLAQYLVEVGQGRDVGGFRAELASRLRALEQIHWLVPPLLSPRTTITFD